MFESFEDFGNPEEQHEQMDKFDEARHLDQTPPEHGIAQDITVSDDIGGSLTLRIEDGTKEQFEQALRHTEHIQVEHQTRIRTYDGSQQVGAANLRLEVDKVPSKEAVHGVRVTDCRMKLEDIYVPPSEHGNGIGTLMLGRVEQLAWQSGARELYGTLESEKARPFFEKHGYQFRGAHDKELFKTYYFK